jgi:hypothetical protein
MSALRAAHVSLRVHAASARREGTRGSVGHRRGRPRAHEEDEPQQHPSLCTRRMALTAAVLVSTSTTAASTQAEIRTPKGYDDPSVSASGFNTSVTGNDTLGCQYSIQWPSGWCALSDLSSARTVGVDNSWKDPSDEASTLAVFVSIVAPSIKSQLDRGTIDSVAKTRAESAPRQVTSGKRTRKTRVGSSGKATTYDVETKVGGGTAGRFGQAVELVAITVYGGKEYLVRATASGSSWNTQKQALRTAVESFEILETC